MVSSIPPTEEGLLQLTPLEMIKYFMYSAMNSSEQYEECMELLEKVDWESYTPPMLREEYGRLIR
jgi:hypothetical protein